MNEYRLTGLIVFILMVLNAFYILLLKYRQPVYGKDGPRGRRGPPGRKGILGKKGLKGEVGKIGVPGETIGKGTIGIIGIRGPKGNIGERGERGERGEEGDLGQKGDLGERGPPGPPGIPGEPGKKGKKGIDSNVVSYATGEKIVKTDLSTYQIRNDKQLYQVNNNLDWDNFITGYKLKASNAEEDYGSVYTAKFKIVTKK